MSLIAGTRLGPYEISAEIGAGGMGIVYRGRDTKLHRDVALKVLPESFALDPDRLARFQREAHFLASLNHPNIAAIYGLEESPSTSSGQAGVQALVLELVEGPTLADRIARGPIPLREALPMARQIAEALEAAHEHGIVHRDLKPSNIKVRPDGTVKVLDFGLAKLTQPPASGSQAPGWDVTASPTIAVPAATRAGVILGTAAYMAPEQATGQEADRTADVWSFGAVLYEMLAGRVAFSGASVTEILSEVLKSEPDWSRLPAETPAGVRRLLQRCLRKERRDRLQHLGDARIEIADALEARDDSGHRLRFKAIHRRERVAWIAALVTVTLIAAAAMAAAFRPAPAPPEVRLDIITPPARTADPTSLAISPDGRHIVFAAVTDGRQQLWLRPLDSGTARPLAPTDDVGFTFPFWSPDSRFVGFFADGKLKRIDVESGSIETLANAPGGRGGAWNHDGTILFALSPGSPIFRMSAAGGEAVAVTRIETPQQTEHRFPQFLPDGRHFIFYVRGTPEGRGVYLGELGRPDARRLFDADSAAVCMSSGHLLFVRQGTLFAQTFDVDRLAVKGEPMLVAEQVAINQQVGHAALAASDVGSFVYRAGRRRTQLVWFDRSGKELGSIGNPDDDVPTPNPSLSSDGRRLALNRNVGGNADIWLVDMLRGVLSRVTSDDVIDIRPVWSPDGSRIAFTSIRPGTLGLYQQSASGAGGAHLLVAMQSGATNDWSPDGRFLLYQSSDPKTGFDLWALPLNGDGTPFAVVQTGFEERDGQFSPDGKWIAYQSNESGRPEIHVRPFPGPGGQWQISASGGTQARWGPDGQELFYVAPDGRLVAVTIQVAAGGQAVEAGRAAPLFTTRMGGVQQAPNGAQYAVSADGQRFLMNTVLEDPSSAPITIVLNWKPSP